MARRSSLVAVPEKGVDAAWLAELVQRAVGVGLENAEAELALHRFGEPAAHVRDTRFRRPLRSSGRGGTTLGRWPERAARPGFFPPYAIERVTRRSPTRSSACAGLWSRRNWAHHGVPMSHVAPVIEWMQLRSWDDTWDLLAGPESRVRSSQAWLITSTLAECFATTPPPLMPTCWVGCLCSTASVSPTPSSKGVANTGFFFRSRRC